MEVVESVGTTVPSATSDLETNSMDNTNLPLLQSSTQEHITDALRLDADDVCCPEFSQEVPYDSAATNDPMLLWDEFLSDMTNFSTYRM